MSLAPTPVEHELKIHGNWNLFIASVVIFCMMFILFRYYSELKQLLCNLNSASSSRNRRTRLSEPAFEDHSLQFHSNALESSLVHSLPVTQFKKKHNQEESKTSTTGVECAVCLGEFEEGEWLKHLPNCAHVFHKACIDTWFEAHSNCPLCRSLVYDPFPDRESFVSTDTLLETLRREDFSQERAAHYQVLRSDILMHYSSTVAPSEAAAAQHTSAHLRRETI